MSKRPARRNAFRRYPALAFIVGAGALALLLPTALNVPTSGPSTLAEFAPVPGSGQGESDLSDLGGGSSGGLGFGSGKGVAEGIGSVAQGPAGQKGARLKRCVGNPPRQTEDELSPPCVAFFDGDNGGATTRGVKKDEVSVVIYGGPASPARFYDLDDPNYHDTDPQSEAYNVIVQGLARFFNSRYQTYGRHVHFYGYKTPAQPEAVRAGIDEITRRWQPFGLITTGLEPASATAKEAASRQIVAASYSAFDRTVQGQSAPFLLSYAPDLQDEARIAASYVCRKLVGRPARHSGNPTDQSRTRKFGLLYQDSATAPEHRGLKDHFRREVGAQCGLTELPEGVARTTNEGQGDYALNIASMRTSEVTTIVSFSSGTGPSGWGSAGQAQGYFPEWVVPGKSSALGADDNSQARTYAPAVWANAFGITYDYVRNARIQQQWYLAFREGCPNCADPANDIKLPQTYDALNMLFWGIQAAGPRLIPANLDKGLHAIPARGSPNPSVPAAYFAPGNYSWIKDAMEIWWDAAGTPPGEQTPGCYRVANGGDRFRAGEWSEGDGTIKVSGAPCQGSVR